MSEPHSSIDNNQTQNRFSKRKRGIKPDSPESTELKVSAKKHKSQKMSQKDIDELKSFMQSLVTTSQTSIESKLNEFSSNVHDEVRQIKESIDTLKSDLNNDVDSIKNHIAKHTERMDNNEDDINRLKLIADLKLIGVPFKQNENLFETFNKIAAAIGYNSSLGANMPFVKRILMRNKATGTMIESHVISLHFTSIQHKNHFYSLYLKHMPLKPELLGLGQNIKITIGENLTRINVQLFKYAQQCKKEKKIAQVFTNDGLVKIKFVKGPNQHAYTIRQKTQLDILLKEREQKQPQALMDIDDVNITANDTASNGIVPSSSQNQSEQTHQQPQFLQIALDLNAPTTIASNSHHANAYIQTAQLTPTQLQQTAIHVNAPTTIASNSHHANAYLQTAQLTPTQLQQTALHVNAPTIIASNPSQTNAHIQTAQLTPSLMLNSQQQQQQQLHQQQSIDLTSQL